MDSTIPFGLVLEEGDTELAEFRRVSDPSVPIPDWEKDEPVVAHPAERDRDDVAKTG